MVNQAIIVGRLSRDPKQVQTQSGKDVAYFTVAAEYGYGDKKSVDYIDVQAWGGSARFVGQYLKQGALVAVEGRNSSSRYQKEGEWVNTQFVNASSVKALEPRGSSNANQQEHHAPSSFQQPAPTFESTTSNDAPELDITNDDLPF